jgi:hypothetical protein
VIVDTLKPSPAMKRRGRRRGDGEDEEMKKSSGQTSKSGDG